MVKKAPSTVFCMRSFTCSSLNKSFPITDAGTMARGCWMCQACWSHYLYPSVSMAPVLLATLNFLFTCQWCCTSLSTAAYTLSCCRPLKVNSLRKASLAASPHKTKLDLVWNSVEQNTWHTFWVKYYNCLNCISLWSYCLKVVADLFWFCALFRVCLVL